MAWEDEVLRRALVGRPSLRRRLASIDSGRRDEFVELNQDIDPVRNKDLYRRRLSEFADTEAAAQPLRRRQALIAGQQRALASGNQALAGQFVDRLRRLRAGPNSIEDRFNPDRPGSLASRRLPGLYRG